MRWYASRGDEVAVCVNRETDVCVVCLQIFFDFVSVKSNIAARKRIAIVLGS